MCMLNKALYGLRESPRDWYECLDSYLSSLGFERSEYDNCLYTFRVRDYLLNYICRHFDLLKKKRKLEFYKKFIKERFQMNKTL